MTETINKILDVVINIQTSLSNIAERQLKIMDDFEKCKEQRTECLPIIKEIQDKKKDGNGDGRTPKINGSDCCLL